jgi:hypothetical protein
MKRICPNCSSRTIGVAGLFGSKPVSCSVCLARVQVSPFLSTVLFYSGFFVFVLVSIWAINSFGVLAGCIAFAVWFIFEVTYKAISPLSTLAGDT